MTRSAESLRNILAIDRMAYRMVRHTFEDWLKTLHQIHKETERLMPKDTANALAKAIGRHEAEVLVGSIALLKAWDGRIDDCVIEWAKNLDGVCDASAADILGLGDCKIHLAHLNQIALALMAHAKG